MPNEQSTELARRLKLVITVDDAREATSLFKLPASLRADVLGDLAVLARLDALTGTTEGARTEASATLRGALEELERQLRGGHRFIQALDETVIKEKERAGLFETYLWKGGQIGRFDDGRCLSLAQQAVKVDSGNLVKVEWRYPAVRLARIVAQLEIIEEEAGDATGAERQGATKVRDVAMGLAETTLLRARFFYCSATRDGDQSPELARIEFQPRRDPGTVAEAKKADAPVVGAAPVVPPVG